MELRRKNDLARVEAEAVATAKKERENWDIRKQEIELQGREKTKMILESMQLVEFDFLNYVCIKLKDLILWKRLKTIY